jgi:hypothetical protein
MACPVQRRVTVGWRKRGQSQLVDARLAETRRPSNHGLAPRTLCPSSGTRSAGGGNLGLDNESVQPPSPGALDLVARALSREAVGGPWAVGPGPDGRRMRAVRTAVGGEEGGRRGPARAVQLCNVDAPVHACRRGARDSKGRRRSPRTVVGTLMMVTVMVMADDGDCSSSNNTTNNNSKKT